jgi:hypothetical protein
LTTNDYIGAGFRAVSDRVMSTFDNVVDGSLAEGAVSAGTGMDGAGGCRAFDATYACNCLTNGVHRRQPTNDNISRR